MKTINEIIKNAYEKFGDRNFIFTKLDNKYTPIMYRSFLEKSDTFAQILLDDGLGGNNIMVIGKNYVEYMIADLAVTAYIGTCVNINYKLDYDSLAQIIGRGDIASVLYDEELTEKITILKEKYPNLKFRELQSTVKKLSKNEQLFNFPEKDMDACSKIIFTSGTADKPKGVMLSLRNILCGWKRRTQPTLQSNHHQKKEPAGSDNSHMVTRSPLGTRDRVDKIADFGDPGASNGFYLRKNHFLSASFGKRKINFSFSLTSLKGRTTFSSPQEILEIK